MASEQEFAPVASAADKSSIADKLLELSRLKEEGTISQEAFETYRNAYLSEARGGPKAPPLPADSLPIPAPALVPAPASAPVQAHTPSVPVAAPSQAVVVATSQAQATTIGVPANFSAGAYTQQNTDPFPNAQPPGRWVGSNGSDGSICSCFSNIPVCAMTYFCYCVVLGQLHSRVVEPMSCKRIGFFLLAVTAITEIMTNMMLALEDKDDDEDEDDSVRKYFWGYVGISNTGHLGVDLVLTMRNLFFLYYGVKVRKAFRARDQIPETICGGRNGTEDCICMWFCATCNYCMMMSHDLEVQNQQYDPACCNYTEIGAGHLQENPPRTEQPRAPLGVFGSNTQPGVMGTVAVQAQAAAAQPPQLGVVVQGTVVQGK